MSYSHPPAIYPNLGRGAAGGGGGWHKASVSDCLPLAAPIGLSPLLVLTLCGPERVLVVSTEPRDDLSCLTTPGVGRPGDGGGGGGLTRPRPVAPPSQGVQGLRHGALTKPRGYLTRGHCTWGPPMWWFAPGFGTPRESIRRSPEGYLPVLPLDQLQP